MGAYRIGGGTGTFVHEWLYFCRVSVLLNVDMVPNPDPTPPLRMGPPDSDPPSTYRRYRNYGTQNADLFFECLILQPMGIKVVGRNFGAQKSAHC